MRSRRFYQALAAGETQREGDVLKVKNTKSGKTMQLTFYEGREGKWCGFQPPLPLKTDGIHCNQK